MMKRCLNLIILVLAATVSVASAADSGGHEQYRIISFNFSDQIHSDKDGHVNRDNVFDPLLITGSRADILSRNPFFVNEFGTSDTQTITSGFAVSADYMATQKISLHGVIGVAKNNWDASTDSSYSSSWEANLGIVYRLFNNLSYGVHFGYMETGDLYKKNSNTYDSVESIIMVSNQLTMSF